MTSGLSRRPRLDELLPEITHAVVLDDLEIRLQTAVDRHADLPGTREHRRVLDGRFVVEMIGVDGRVALDDMKLVAVVVAGIVQPRLIVEVLDVDDQRITFPPAPRVAHPEVERLDMRAAVG